MTFISYAQNYEDVMLFRALRGIENGFYIDVGAQHPVADSVTKAFYERGWHGINLEPVPVWYDALKEDRPRDVNLRVAASDHSGTLHFYEIAESGLSTMEAAFAAQHAEAGRQVIEYEIECRPLGEICAKFSVSQVHFLKIDAEGAEAAVLRGLPFDRIRPWIIVIEATLPNSQTPAWQEWHPLLDSHDYSCVYEDGLNRFYLAREHQELEFAFRVPPNVLDNFEQHRTMAALDYMRAENERREAALVELRERTVKQCDELQARGAEVARQDRELQLQQAELSRLRTEIDRLHDEAVAISATLSRQHEEIRVRDQIIADSIEAVRAVRASMSWRITAPLRWVSLKCSGARRIARRGVRHILRPPARMARPAMRRLAQVTWLRVLLIKLFGTDSRIAERARLFLFGPRDPVSGLQRTGGAQLTRSAQRVLHEIEVLRKQNGMQ